VERSLADQVAVVTGAGHGIGQAIAAALSEAGARVALVDIDEPAGRGTAEAIAHAGGDARFFATDVSSPESVRAMADTVLSQFGRADILVNDAAIFPRSRFTEMDWSEWQRVIQVNLHGPFLCTRALVDSMVARGSGRIVNIASGLGVTGGINAAHYATAKGGLIALTKSLALELAPFGITANALVPGLADTRMPRSGGQTEADVQALVQQIPLKRLTQPCEVAHMLVFLVGPNCSYVTGQTIFVNGGWIMP
jgi:3-oxoacyl-[acyl-carrier protein] reductase